MIMRDQAWPEMQLRIAPASGHSMYAAGLQSEVIRATDAFRALDEERPAGEEVLAAAST